MIPHRNYDPHQPPKLSPIAVGLSIARGLEEVSREDPHHVIFGRLSPFSVMIEKDNNAFLHLRGASDLSLRPHSVSPPPPQSSSKNRTKSPPSSLSFNSQGSSSSRSKNPMPTNYRPKFRSVRSPPPPDTYYDEYQRTKKQNHKPLYQKQFTDGECVTLIDGGFESVRWRAPEVGRGEPPTVASGVFSFGMIMWEMVTEEVPWSHLSAVEAERYIQNGDRPSLTLIPDSDVMNLIERCWAHEPERRMPILQVIDFLEEIEDNQAIDETLMQYADYGENPDSSTLASLFSMDL